MLVPLKRSSIIVSRSYHREKQWSRCLTLPHFRRVEAGKSHLSGVGRDDRSAPNDPGPVDQEVTGNWQRDNIEQALLCCTVWDDTGLFQTHMAHFPRFSLIRPGWYGTSAPFP